MEYRRSFGFTIIETMLFLAVSGLMVIGLLAGVGSVIRDQQYKDAVQSYANFLRVQHGQVITVINNRGEGDACPLLASESAAGTRGTSQCVIVGRHLSTGGVDATGAVGEDYVARPVYAHLEGTGIDGLPIWDYALGEADLDYSTNWSVVTKFLSGGSTSDSLGVLMWRDPDDGSVRVVADGDTDRLKNVDDLIKGFDPAVTGSAEICVLGQGFLPPQGNSVFIARLASSSDAIYVGNSTEGCKP